MKRRPIDDTSADELRARLEAGENDPKKLRLWVQDLLDDRVRLRSKIDTLSGQVNELASRLPAPGMGIVNDQKGRAG
jgi:hypothetical protein